MLRLTLNPIGKKCLIELNGQDISRFIRSVTVQADVNDNTRAVLEYSGLVVIDGEPRAIELRQAEFLTRCDECAKVVQGEEQPVRVVDVSALGGSSKAYAAVTE